MMSKLILSSETKMRACVRARVSGHQTSQSAPETVCKDVYDHSSTINESPFIDFNEILIASLIHSPFFYRDISNRQGDMELFYSHIYYTHLTPLQ